MKQNRNRGKKMKIENLRLRAFRGATKDVSIEFDPSKKITLIFGENGTGKSTIIDGLTFLCEQNRGSLDDRSGANNDKFIVSAGQPKENVLVGLKIGKDNWEANFQGNSIVVSPQTGFPNLSVLRRARLSNFIDAQPKQRFDALKEFVETPKVESAESSLREAEKTSKSNLNQSVRDFNTANDQLEKLWIEEGKIGANKEFWANEINSSDTTALEGENKKLEQISSSARIICEKLRSYKSGIDTETAAQTSFNECNANLELEKKSVADGSSEILDIITKANAYIEKNAELNQCPVCENKINAKELSAELQAKITKLDALKKATDQFGAANKALTKSKEENQKIVIDFLEKAQVLDTSISENPTAIAANGKFTFNNQSFEQLNGVNIDGNSKKMLIDALIKILEDFIAELKSSIDRNQKTITLKNTVKLHLQNIADNKAAQEKYSKLSAKLSMALGIVERERKKFASDIFTEMSDEISKLYERVHPGEDISEVIIELDPKKRGSVNLIGNFQNQPDTPPQAYYSESHLDTLGICIWLAFTKKFSSGNSLIILDDVLTSVDVVHLDRIIELIDDEADSFGHVVLTTHYRPWRDRYRYNRAPASKIHFIELKEWSPERGILTDTNQPSLDELKHYLKPEYFDRQKLASLSGIFLESILDVLTLKYAVKMPRKAAQDYTLGEYLLAFSPSKRDLLRTEHFDVSNTLIKSTPLRPILDELDKLSWIRNQVGCHFNISGQETSDKDVRFFAEKTAELAEALICPKGGGLPSKLTKDGSCWRSKHGNCKLYPAQIN